MNNNSFTILTEYLGKLSRNKSLFSYIKNWIFLFILKIKIKRIIKSKQEYTINDVSDFIIFQKTISNIHDEHSNSYIYGVTRYDDNKLLSISFSLSDNDIIIKFIFRNTSNQGITHEKSYEIATDKIEKPISNSDINNTNELLKNESYYILKDLMLIGLYKSINILKRVYLNEKE